ncbi:hypothetical protein LCGC14_2024330, partial [marine sediment metagenome]
MKVIVGTRDAGTPASVWAYDDSGNALWVYDTGGNTNKVVTDSSNNIYVVGVRANGSGANKTLWKLNSIGVLTDSYLHDTAFGFNSVALDSSGIIYVSGQVIA